MASASHRRRRRRRRLLRSHDILLLLLLLLFHATTATSMAWNWHPLRGGPNGQEATRMYQFGIQLLYSVILTRPVFRFTWGSWRRRRNSTTTDLSSIT
ncbi:hypothetical protein AXF42_Ash015950 [Apostasia shenzhenica]|uniref:Uncharacterized protein n=1 Tax=Apostasia shenzhenica TaxID=1088818 RepID=A0A2I0AWH4_9ASPA|nr:hypothetical protein AXF42_Ash015950 [Apostasia shenzhenica]